MPKVASTTFDLQTKVDLLVADVYETVPKTEPLNAIPLNIGGTVDQVINNIQGLITEQGIYRLADDIRSGARLDKDYLLGRLKEATGGTFSDINSLKNQVLDQALNRLGFNPDGKALVNGLIGVPGSPDPKDAFFKLNPRLKVIYDGVEYLRNTDEYNIEDYQTAFKVLGNITGNAEIAQIVDMEAKFSAVNSLLRVATNLNVPFLLDEALGNLPQDEKTQVLKDALPVAAQASNLPMVNQIVTEIKPGAALASKPELIEFLLANFRVLNSTNGVNLSHAVELVNTLNAIKPNWNKVDRNGELVINGAVYYNVSDDAFRALTLLDEHRTWVQLPRKYGTLKNRDSLRIAFPLVGSINS